MSGLVPRFETVADLIQAVNDVRDHVVGTLTEYLVLAARMREFEDAFRGQVLHSAQQLQEVIENRTRLEAECARIRANIERGVYASAAEIEDDARSALAGDPVAEWEAAAEAGGSALQDDLGERDDGHDLDPATKQRIIRDFKRVVLPAVHADTSDASFSAFETAHSAYQDRDYVVMEALVIQYRGPLAAIDQNDLAISGPQARAWLKDYRAAAQRLDARLRATTRHATDSELHHPEHARQRMAERHQQILRAIDEETERVRELRGYLETLLRRGRDDAGAQ